MLRTENIRYQVGKKQILKGISTSFETGKMIMILGPNGSGKSSFLKIFSGENRDFEGEVFVEGQNLRAIPIAELAKMRAVLSQQPHLQFPLTVREVVMMGRYPFFQFNPTAKDHQVCGEALSALHLSALQNRNYLTLSGGEKQRVQYARVLAQIWEKPADNNRYLFLDEPLNSLDIKYQQEFLSIARNFMNEKTLIIAIIHDINLALRFADEIMFMKDGQMVAKGDLGILNEELIREVFEVDARIVDVDGSNRPIVVL